ncbi:MAG TPA: thiamine pyrophosphate-binding protein [Spirochaetia bacterium]|nr:thiamine pyrophosphate-binding protein [Spirochaetales bacterium]HRY80528.1 thiamine pyrophosphate-binding protein [Spirochaetia bacterium]
MTVAERLVARLRSAGIRRVFGVPSGSWLYYMDAMRAGGVDFVLVANEATAGFMADVSARLTGIPGACYGTVGPGATNLSTGVGGALLDRSPLLAFTSEPPEKMLGRTVQMAVDHQALYRPLTKWTTRLAPDRVDQVLDQALQIALSDMPGPVHIGLPEDLGPKETTNSPVAAGLPPVRTLGPASEDALRSIETAMSASRRPVLAVGLSAVRAGLGPRLIRIAEKHRMPIILTPMAKGLVSENHPLYVGVLFHALSDRVAATHKEADLVVAVGYDPIEFNYEDWMPSVPLLCLDTLPADIDRILYPEVTDVTGDIGTSLLRLEALAPLDSRWDLKELAGRRDAMFRAMEPPPGSFGPRAALAGLREALPEDGIMTCDVGAHIHLVGQMWRTPAPGLQLMTNGWSSMGFGIPAALAAKLCRPDRKVACVTGDGGFHMMAGEMATARRIGLPIVFVLLDDRSLDLIRLKQDKKKMPRYGTDLLDRDYPHADSVFGVPVIRAGNASDYRDALSKAFKSDGPVIVEASIDASEYDDLILRKHK